MQQQQTVAAIILAAGSSSRMKDGQHKLLLPLKKRPIIVHVVETALASQAEPIYVILGNRAEQITACLSEHKANPRLHIIHNESYHLGMSSSLRSGIQAILNDQDHKQDQTKAVSGALILLGDQPLMTHTIIDALIQTHLQTNGLIIAPNYAGRRGNPVLFATRLFPELLTITGDQGGKSIIEKYRHDVISVAFQDAKAYTDVDTWESYQQVQATYTDQ